LLVIVRKHLCVRLCLILMVVVRRAPSGAPEKLAPRSTNLRTAASLLLVENGSGFILWSS